MQIWEYTLRIPTPHRRSKVKPVEFTDQRGILDAVVGFKLRNEGHGAIRDCHMLRYHMLSAVMAGAS